MRIKDLVDFVYWEVMDGHRQLLFAFHYLRELLFELILVQKVFYLQGEGLGFVVVLAFWEVGFRVFVDLFCHLPHP